jgi:saccharopine dehydrogenase-like NADP-dependent oxidoreductase
VTDYREFDAASAERGVAADPGARISPKAVPAPSPRRRVLVIGGRGGFGLRLTEGILATTAFNVIVAGRDAAAAHATANAFGRRFGPDRVSALALDRERLVAADLAERGLFCVIDAAGPYQGREPTVARAAIAAGVHSLDLADARDFVAAFAVLDGDARAAGVAAMTGASSTPALSNAVIQRLTDGWLRIDDILVAIYPGNRAPRGLAVVRSILSYIGRPVRVFREGRWGSAPGWGLLERRSIAGLGWRWL